jgi:hypothetical protein
MRLLNRGTRHLPPVSARRQVVKGGTLGQKMRPARRSRPTRASEWPWVITGGEPSAARRVLRSSERLQQPSGGANVSPPRIFPTNPPPVGQELEVGPFPLLRRSMRPSVIRRASGVERARRRLSVCCPRRRRTHIVAD